MVAKIKYAPFVALRVSKMNCTPPNHDLMTSTAFAEYSPHTVPDST